MRFSQLAPTLCCALQFPNVPFAILRSPAVRACDATESSTAASLNEPVLILPSGGVYAAAEVVPDSEVKSASEEYSVFLMNDGFNMREYVSRVLMMVCYVDEARAERIMMEANWEYQACVGVYERPVAQHVLDGLRKAGLEAAMVPSSDLV